MTDPAAQLPPAPPPQSEGMFQFIVNAAKNLTLTNVLIIALLVVILVPAYFIWRALNDPVILNRITSNFQVITDEKSPCTIRIYSIRGGDSTYSISTGFAFQGGDRYVVAVHMDRTPDQTSIDSYCETLQLIVDFMRRPDAPSPKFPNTDEPLIWPYAPEKSP